MNRRLRKLLREGHAGVDVQVRQISRRTNRNAPFEPIGPGDESRKQLRRNIRAVWEEYSTALRRKYDGLARLHYAGTHPEMIAHAEAIARHDETLTDLDLTLTAPEQKLNALKSSTDTRRRPS